MKLENGAIFFDLRIARNKLGKMLREIFNYLLLITVFMRCEIIIEYQVSLLTKIISIVFHEILVTDILRALPRQHQFSF